MIRHLLLASLVATIAITGCSRKSDTNDPETTKTPETEVVEETTVVEEDTGTPDYSSPSTTDDASGTDDTDSGAATSKGTDNIISDSPESDGQMTCNAEWFEWVNTEVMKTQSEAITENYPTGLPEVGSDEWFTAVDKLTGGDGAHGPDGGSDEWCSMIQQRLSSND